MAEIIHLTEPECGDGITVEPATVLKAAIDAGLTGVVVAGYYNGGALYVAGSHGSPESLLLVERAKAVIIGGAEQ